MGNLTGGEIIDLFMKLHGNGDIEKRDGLIKRFELDPKKKLKDIQKVIVKSRFDSSFISRLRFIYF